MSRIKKPKCPRCGFNTLVSRVESDQTNGVLVSYCFNNSHPRIRIRTITEKNVPRRIRNDRMKKLRDYNTSFNMQNIKCVGCGKVLDFSSNGSYQTAGKIIGHCWKGKDNGLEHRLQLTVYGKPAYQEPNCDELFEVIVRESKR